MSQKNAKAFIEKIKTDEELQQKFLALSKNDWKGLEKIGNEIKFQFTKKEFITVVPDEFWLSSGNHPDRGWDKPME